MKNRSTLFILGGLFIVLLVISVAQSNRVTISTPETTATLPPAQALLNNASRVFTDFQPDNVLAFSVLDPDTGATFTLIRDTDRWTSMEFGDVIESSTADLLALTVTAMPYLQTLPDVTADKYAEYGLTKEKAFLVISVLLKDKKEHGIIVGNVLPDAKGHYALVDDRTEVYALDARPIAFLVSYLRQVYLPTATPGATPTSGE